MTDKNGNENFLHKKFKRKKRHDEKKVCAAMKVIDFLNVLSIF